MDFKERIKRLEERRGESIDTMWQRHVEEVRAAMPEDADTPAKVAQLLSGESDDDRMMALMGSLENFRQLMNERFGLQLPEISLEDGFIDTLKNILDKVLAWMAKAYYACKESMLATKVMLDDTMDKHEDMTSMSRLHRRTDLSTELVMKTRLNYYVCRGRYITNSSSLLQVLKRTATVITTYFNMAKHHFPLGATELATAVQRDAPLPELARIARSHSPLVLFGERGFDVDANQLHSFDMFGNLTAHLEADMSGDDFDIIRSLKFGLEETRGGRLEIPESLTFVRFSQSTTDEILGHVGAIGRATDAAIGGFLNNDRHKYMQSLRDAVKTIRGRLDAPEQMAWEESDYRQMVSVIETYLAWMSTPFLEMSSHAIRVMKAQLNLVEANLT